MQIFISPFQILIFMLLLALNPSFAQVSYVMADKPELSVSGTSTLHDWSMNSIEASGKAQASIKNKALEGIPLLTFAMPSHSLKSGRNQMDRIAYQTLDAEKHPEITFALSALQEITPQYVTARGNLTIAGTTREVIMRVNYTILENNILFTGSTDIAFSEFNMKPPTALLGTVRTGDELKVSFNVTFKPETKTIQ